MIEVKNRSECTFLYVLGWLVQGRGWTKSAQVLSNFSKVSYMNRYAEALIVWGVGGWSKVTNLYPQLIFSLRSIREEGRV